MMALRRLRGFILPLAVLLVLILTISGTAFMHHDYLERRMATNNLDNQGAFYLGNAGIERARETFKIPQTDQTWTSVLNGTYDGPINPGPDYPVDPTPVFCPLCLCGPNAASGCVIPSFGALVNSGIPFDAMFGAGQYEVRAFNNELSLTDTDQILIFRALGTIRGEQKLLEVTVLATSAGNLITCSVDPCPSKANGQPTDCDITTNPTCDPMPGREPGIGPIPEPDFPLTDPQNYYRIDTTLNPVAQAAKRDANFKDIDDNPLLSAYDDFVGNTNLNPADNTYYFVDGDVTLQNDTATNVVIFATGQLEIKANVTLTNAVLVGVQGVNFSGNAEIRAPDVPYLHYPVVFSGDEVTQSSGSANVFGNVYAVGTVDINPLDIQGATFGNGVEIQGSSDFSDDANLRYYTLMKGFVYDPADQTMTMLPGTWRELQ